MIKVTVQKLVEWVCLLCVFSIIGIVIAIIAMRL